MADAAELDLLDAVQDYVERAVRPYREALAELQSKTALDIADLRAQLAAKPDAKAQTEIISRGLTDAVAKLPRPVDGKSVSAEELRPMVEDVIARSIAAMPKPKDGLQGPPGKDAEVDYDRIGDVIVVAVAKETAKFQQPKDGKDGKDATIDYGHINEIIKANVVTAVAALPKPENGKDGAPGLNGKDGAPGLNGKDGAPGERGESGVRGEKGETGDAGPQGERGEKGEAGDRGEMGPAGQKGADGTDGDRGAQGEKGADGVSIHADTVRLMVDEVVRAAVAQIPSAKDGEPGKSIDPQEVVRMVDAEVARQFEELAPFIKGEPGAPGLSPDDLEFEYTDEKTMVVRLKRAGMQMVERSAPLPVPMDCGIYVRGKAYRKGDIVTYGGSAFIAQCDTKAEIGGEVASKDWRLLVQRGRDAR